MEDDDDFGDLYTDVLLSFPSSSQPSSSSSSFPPPPPQQQLRKSSDSLQSGRPRIDLNLQLEDDEEEFGDHVAAAAPVSDSQTLKPHAGLELNLGSSVANSRDDAKVGDVGNFDEESFRFDLEEEAQEDVGLGPVIPGLSTGGGVGDGDGGAEDWDSDDSEDDLQIVLNETSQDPMAMELGGDLDDGQNEGLGIGADGHGLVGFQHPGMEDHEWGEDGAQAADGEKKEGGGDMTKLNQGIPMAPKPGYVGHGYHTFHSQFKYVRPGAAPIQGAPTAGPVGAPGQVRPIQNLGPMAGGRGRGDWRPPVMKNAPGMQKSYGGPGWGISGGGRGLGIGLDFTLPSHKTIFEVDTDGFEEKPWNNPSVDVTDFFNFGLTEESWKGYCKQLEQFRLASTMQSRIRVYESGRSEQAYDPDMPPELAAAAGVSDTAAENINFRTDVDHIDMAKSSAPVRPPMPTGRPIQVETGCGERLPSIDTRPPRMRESDAIIEIVCEGFAEGQSSEDDAPQSSEHGVPTKTNHTESHGSEGMHEQSKCGAIHSPRERMESSPVKLHHHSEPSGSREHSPMRSSGSEERFSRRLKGESPENISGGNNMQDDQSDGSIDRIDGKSNMRLSPGNVKDGQELNADHIDKNDDDDPPSAVELEPAALEEDVKYDKTSPGRKQDTVSPHSERQPVALSSSQDYGEDLKATRNGDNSNPRLGSSKGYMKPHVVGEEVVQGRQGESMRNRKRHLGDDEHNIQKRNHAERHDMERSRNVVRGREDLPAHRVGGLAKPSYVKYESSDKRKERDSSEGVWPRREDPHEKRARTNEYRNQDPRYPEHGDEMGSRYSSKAWDGDRIGKEDPLYTRKYIDTGNWRVHHDKDVSLRQRERDNSLKTRHENIDNHKRRKNEENPRRDYSEKEELMLGRRESPGLRRREKEDHLDQKRRIDQERTRENIKDHHSVRLKDDMRMEREKSERPNERDDRHRTKQYREGSTTKREREEVREPVRSGRGIEDKWPIHAKEKDEFSDSARYAESKRRDRADDVHLLNHRVHEDKYAHGTTSANLVPKQRKDGPSSHTNHNASSNRKIADEKLKESTKNKEYDSRSLNSQTISKTIKSDHSSHKGEKVGTKHSSSQGNTEHQTEAHTNSIGKSGEEPATDNDEQQQSKKGRSKMERWTSHKERDFAAIVKPAPSLEGKERIRSSINTESSVSAEPADNPTKSAESIDPKPSVEDVVPQVVDTKKDNTKEVEHKNGDPLQAADQHLDTVAKLKKRSERFKVPLTSEKEVINKKKETETLLPPQTENRPAEPEVKSERPPRKRRWISN